MSILNLKRLIFFSEVSHDLESLLRKLNYSGLGKKCPARSRAENLEKVCRVVSGIYRRSNFCLSISSCHCPTITTSQCKNFLKEMVKNLRKNISKNLKQALKAVLIDAHAIGRDSPKSTSGLKFNF